MPASTLESIVRDAVPFRMLFNSPRQLNADDLRIIVKKTLGTVGLE